MSCQSVNGKDDIIHCSRGGGAIIVGLSPAVYLSSEARNGINSEEMNRKAIHTAIVRNLPSIGGSDCHSREQVGRAFAEFKNPVSMISALIEEIKNGNCRGVIAP